MAYDPGQIDATLAAAVGDDPILIAELRSAFRDSAARALEDIVAARDEEQWRGTTARLRGLAASFGAVRLMALATEAGEAKVGEGDVIRRLKRMVARV